MSDEIKKVYFEPSTIENIDRSVFSYIESLSLSVDTNEGFTQVPVLWGTSERSFLSKDKKEVRDDQGTLKFPLISIRRSSFSKPLKSGGIFQGNVPETPDEQGGSLPIGKVMYQEKTMAFANAEAQRLHNQSNYPSPNHKVVYKTVYAPMPVNVEVMYEITLRTEYQQQMNDLMLPFVTKPGTINYVLLKSEGHKYEGFIQDQHQSSDNLSDFSSAERKFETKINLKVIGYLVGQGKNREKAHFSVRQSFVEVKMPRERIVMGDVPDRKNGAYYGLPGPDRSNQPAPQYSPWWSLFSTEPSPSSRSGPPGAKSSNRVDRLIIKKKNVAPGHSTILEVPGFVIFPNSEEIYKSSDEGITYSVLTPGRDYTISGNTITFTANILTADEIFINYIKG